METQFELPRIVTLPHVPSSVMWLSFPLTVTELPLQVRVRAWLFSVMTIGPALGGGAVGGVYLDFDDRAFEARSVTHGVSPVLRKPFQVPPTCRPDTGRHRVRVRR